MNGGLKQIDEGVSVSAADASEIWAVLDKYMENSRMPFEKYLDAHLETCLFPHVRVANHQVNVFPDGDSYRDVFSHVDDFMQTGWDHSAWTTTRIVQADPTKVHVVTSFARYTKNDELIATEDSLYIVEKVDDHWGIRGRSSFAK